MFVNAALNNVAIYPLKDNNFTLFATTFIPEKTNIFINGYFDTTTEEFCEKIGLVRKKEKKIGIKKSNVGQRKKKKNTTDKGINSQKYLLYSLSNIILCSIDPKTSPVVLHSRRYNVQK